MSNPEGPGFIPEVVGPNAVTNAEGDVVSFDDVFETDDQEPILLAQERAKKELMARQAAEQVETPEADTPPQGQYDEYWEIYDAISDNYSSDAGKRSEAIDQARKKGVAIPPEHLPQQHPLAS